MEKQITVDRAQFLAFQQGILLHFKNGSGIAVDEQACEEAEEALERGETIYLTVNRQIVSKVVDTGECYEEIKVTVEIS